MESLLLTALGTCALLGALPRADLKRLASYADLQSFAAGDTLLTADGAAERFFVLAEGHVDLTVDASNERPTLVTVLARGDVVGIETVLDRAPLAATARALDPVVAVAVLADPFRRDLAEHPPMAVAMLEGASRLVRTLRRENAELRGRSPTERLVDFLLSLATQRDGPATVRLPYEKRTIAALLGVSPESLSRMFARLRPLGVTTTRTDVVRVRDMALLRRAVVEGPAGPGRRS